MAKKVKKVKNNNIERTQIDNNTENLIETVEINENLDNEQVESKIKLSEKIKVFIESAFANDSKFKWLSIALLLIIVFLTYSNIYNNSVHFDDDFVIYNPDLHNPAALKKIFDINKFRFIPFLSFAVNYYVSGDKLASYYFINILIHFVNSVLVFAVVNFLFKSPGMKDHPIAKYANYFSLIAALIFACHPLQTQAVTYIYQRLASLATFFYLASVYYYLKSRLRKKGFFKKTVLIFISLFFIILGIFSKENAFTIPITIILLEITFLTRKCRFIYAAVIISLVIIAVGIYLFYEQQVPEKYLYSNPYLVKIFYPQPNFNGEIVESKNYFITQFKVLPIYFLQLFFPVRQNFDHDFRMVSTFSDPNVIAGIAFIFLSLITALYYYNKNRFIFFGIFWIFITISVESSILPLSDVMFEHRVYLPMLGFALLLIGIVWEILNHKKSVYNIFIGFLILCGVYSAKSYFRNMVWKNEYTLWGDAAEKSPDKARTRFQKGLAALEESKIEEALAEFKKTNEILPTFQAAYSQRAYIYFNTARYIEAIEEYTKYIDITRKTRQYPDGFLNRARTFAKFPNWNMAFADYDKYLKLKPKDVNVMMEVAQIRESLNQPEEAIKQYRQALIADPKFSLAAFKIGKSLFDAGKYQECIQEFTTTIENSAENMLLLSEAFNYRGNAYFKINDNLSSLIDFENAVSLNPNNLSAMQNKIILHRKMGEFDKELETINQVAKKIPDDLTLRFARAKCLIKLKRNDEASKDLEFVISKQPDYKDAAKVLKSLKGKK
jgi:tetratricopeptide (TPR) repeat protein